MKEALEAAERQAIEAKMKFRKISLQDRKSKSVDDSDQWHPSCCRIWVESSKKGGWITKTAHRTSCAHLWQYEYEKMEIIKRWKFR